MKIVSACLAGVPCRYDCQAKERPQVQEWVASGLAIAVCPEQIGGLSTPRPPAEQQGDRVRTSAGVDVTDAYLRGAEACLVRAKAAKVTEAYLKSKSPMCGVGRVYDGSFSGQLIPGNGVFAQKLLDAGIRVYEVD